MRGGSRAVIHHARGGRNAPPPPFRPSEHACPNCGHKPMHWLRAGKWTTGWRSVTMLECAVVLGGCGATFSRAQLLAVA